MKTKIWIINLILIAAHLNSFADSPMPVQGPTLKIVQYNLKSKDLIFEVGSFEQSIDKIEILSDKIKIIPELSPSGTSNFDTLISNASVCIIKKLSPIEFQNLRFVEVSGASYMPAAHSKSGFIGGVTTIGSDEITLNAIAPTIGGKKDSGMVFSSTINTTITDPYEQSNRFVNNSVLIDQDSYANVEFGKSNTSGLVMPINYLIILLYH